MLVKYAVIISDEMMDMWMVSVCLSASSGDRARKSVGWGGITFGGLHKRIIITIQ